jgi:hypothetical protein
LVIRNPGSMIQKDSLISERKKFKKSGALGDLNRGNSKIELKI